MAARLRIPPATKLAFTKVVNEVCERAKLDYEDVPNQSSELITHLELRWEEGVENELSGEAAKERALTLFGDLDEVARTLRRPLWLRMFTYRRCQIHRLTALLVYWGLFVILREELQTPGNFILFDLSEERVSIPRDIIAILAPCLTLALLWRIPRGRGKWVTPRLVVKSLCMVAVTCCNGHLVMLFCYSGVAVDMIWQNLTWSAQDLNSTNLIVAAMAILMAPGGFFTLGCVLVEIFDLPGHAAVSARIQQFLAAANRLGI